MSPLCLECQRREEFSAMSSLEQLAYYIANGGKIEFNVSVRRQKTERDRFYRKIVIERRGIYVTLDGIIDYSTNPPIFTPNKSKIYGKECGPIIFDDAHAQD